MERKSTRLHREEAVEISESENGFQTVFQEEKWMFAAPRIRKACVFLEVSVSEVTILYMQIIELNCGGRVDDIKESEHTEELII